MRLGAAAIAVSMFFVVAWIKNSDIFGLGSVLESNTAYFSTVFVLLTIVAILYGMYGPNEAAF